MFVGLPIDHDAAVENSGVFIEFPAEPIVTGSGMFRFGDLAFEQTNAAASEIVVKWVSQTDRFVFGQYLTGVKTADVVGDISGEKAVCFALDALFESLAVVGKRGAFAGANRTTRGVTKDEHSEDEPPRSALIA